MAFQAIPQEPELRVLTGRGWTKQVVPKHDAWLLLGQVVGEGTDERGPVRKPELQ